MGHTYTRLLTHIIFSTKDRAPVLDAIWRPRLYAYMAGIVNKLDAFPLIIGGVADHVHALVDAPAKLAIAELVQNVKGGSSYWVNRQKDLKTKLAWQEGYGAFSVSPSKIETVRAYIENQEAHHRKQTFQDELRAFLKKSGVKFDETHLWD